MLQVLSFFTPKQKGFRSYFFILKPTCFRSFLLYSKDSLLRSTSMLLTIFCSKDSFQVYFKASWNPHVESPPGIPMWNPCLESWLGIEIMANFSGSNFNMQVILEGKKIKQNSKSITWNQQIIFINNWTLLLRSSQNYYARGSKALGHLWIQDLRTYTCNST